MGWRNRNNAENGTFIDPTYSTQLPPGVSWLTSDVVSVQGIPSDTIYAMQLSFDNRINTAIGGASDNAIVALALISANTSTEHGRTRLSTTILCGS